MSLVPSPTAISGGVAVAALDVELGGEPAAVVHAVRDPVADDRDDVALAGIQIPELGCFHAVLWCASAAIF
jgi:hypothetical protein